MAHYRAARTDANQTELVDVARALGASVEITSGVGNGFPDLVIGIFGITDLIEVKDGSKPPSERKLTKHQIPWHRDWKGSKHIIKNAEEMIALIQSMAKR